MTELLQQALTVFAVIIPIVLWLYSGGARSLQGPASGQDRTGVPQKVRRAH